jgi:uncharacterized protein GlcG (DUF336 family)
MKKIASLVAVATLSMASASAFAWTNCPISQVQAQAALNTATGADTAGGFRLDMWITVVNRDGAVCAVAKSHGQLTVGTPGTTGGDPWPGSRAISAQKANTANSYSNDINAFTSANLWAAVQPGGSLYGLQESNPVNTGVAYRGDPALYGTPTDPMNGLKIGGVNVFGGGVALYDTAGNVLGALGVSGDTSCADHNIGWLSMEALDGVGSIDSTATIAKHGVSGAGIIYDVNDTWGHPKCEGPTLPGNEDEAAVAIGSGMLSRP